MGSNPDFIAAYRSTQLQLLPAHAARPRPGWQAGANGSRIHAINIATDDTTGSQTVNIYRAKVVTANGNMGGAALTSTTITRGSGSFVTDGWIANQRAYLLGSTNLSNDQAVAVTTVAAGTLTLGSFTVEASWPGNLLLASLITTISLPASSGNAATTPAVSGLNSNQWPALIGQPDSFVTLAASEYLLFAVTTTIAAGKSVDLVVDGGDY